MSSNYGSMLLSKVIDSENEKVLTKYNVDSESFLSETDRKVYDFITDYADKNRGQTPSYATVVTEIPEFDYIPNVTDGFEYLSSKVRQRKAQRDFVDLVQREIPHMYEDVGQSDMSEMIDILQDKMDMIKERTKSGVQVGMNIKTDIDDFEEEYRKRQIGESNKVFPSFLSFINDATGGGYASGNIYTVFGKSGRGKSVITDFEAANMAVNGANILIWSMEMGEYDTVTRIYSFISAIIGLTKAKVGDVEYDSGFDSGKLRRGNLDENMEREFFRMLREINHHVKGNITVRGVDDPSFRKRNLKQLESDIEETNADVVVVDPFYYLDYEANTSKTTGGDAAATSERLRHLAGSTDTVIFAITQADETEDVEDNEGNREIKSPSRSDVKKTKQLLEDAALLIGIDTDYKQKMGVVSLSKGRNGGEGEQAEIVYIPSIGVVQEAKIDASMFF